MEAVSETEETIEKEEAVKFGKSPDASLESIKKVAEETQQKYHYVSSIRRFTENTGSISPQQQLQR